MMEGILRMSVTGAVVILVVLLLRLCLRRLPKIFSYALWAIVLFRLLCPVSVSLPISVFNLLTVRQAKVAVIDQFSTRESTWNGQAVLLEQGKQAANGEDFSEQSQSKNQIVRKIPKVKAAGGWQSICTVLWLVGVFGMLAYAAFDMMRLHKRIRSASLDGDNIYLLDGVTSPFVMGIVRPRIYLPYGLSEREREYVLLHEKTHIRRGDPLFRVIAYLALALHWFNPLVWIAFFVSGRDMEMSCDERVLRMLGSNIKREYSNSLLAMAQGKRLATNISLAFGEGGTGNRIKNVLDYKKATVQVAAIGAMVVVLALAALGTNPVERASAKEKTDAASERDGSNTKEVVRDTGENVNAEDDIRAQTKTVRLAEDADEPSSGDVVKAAVSAEISVRSISRSARCIDNYVAPDEEWENTYGDTLAFAEECTYFINYNRWEMNPEEVSFGEFAGVIEKGDISLDKPCILQLGSDGLIYSIRLLKGYYLNGVSYATLPYEEPMPQHAKKLEQVRTETMDIATVPGEETIEIYTGYKDARNCAGAVFLIRTETFCIPSALRMRGCA